MGSNGTPPNGATVEIQAHWMSLQDASTAILTRE